MSLTRFVRRLVAGEQHCRVIIEVSDLGPDGWRRLTADAELSWRRLPASRSAGGGPVVPRRRRTARKLEPVVRADAPIPALLEACGSASGTAAVAKQRLAARATAALQLAGLHGEVLAASVAEPGPEPLPEEAVWPAADGVLIFGPADQDELDRRFAVTASAWALDPDGVRRPSVPERDRQRRRARVDAVAGLCVLPLLLMTVVTVGPWFDARAWALLLAAAAVCVVLPLLVLQALSRGRPFLGEVRNRALGMAAGLLVLLLLARLFARVGVSPPVIVVVSALLVALLAPVALRLLPVAVPLGAVLVAVPLLLAVVAVPVGDLLTAVYLDRLGLRATDVEVTLAQRWWSGAFFGVTALAGTVVAAALWGLVYQLDAVGRRRALPSGPLLAVLGVVYTAAMLALSAGAAWQLAAAGPDTLPGRWGGIHPAWVCWSAVPAGAETPFAGRALPPTADAVAWLGGSPGRVALWSAETGGATLTDQIQLRLRTIPGPCR